jgi:hypothetical protein
MKKARLVLAGLAVGGMASLAVPSIAGATTKVSVAKPALVHASDTWTWTTNHWIKDISESTTLCLQAVNEVPGHGHTIDDDGDCTQGFSLGLDTNTGLFALRAQSIGASANYITWPSATYATATATGPGPNETFFLDCEGTGGKLSIVPTNYAGTPYFYVVSGSDPGSPYYASIGNGVGPGDDFIISSSGCP